MGVPADIQREHPGCGEWSILTAWRGSVSHGTYVPSDDPRSIDDKDLMAVCVPPHDYYWGLREYGSKGTEEIKQGVWDIVVYEARKAFRLLEKGNPNILSLLWLPENMIVKRTHAGDQLIAHRDIFVGRHVFYPFIGYATSQLRKMEGGVYKGYMGDKRRALVERFGYDTKNASHLIRLLRQGIEFLKDGELQVVRPDAGELVAIKRGEWPLDKVKAEAERLFKRAEDAFDRSTLPKGPDHDEINRLCVSVVEHGQALNRQRERERT